MVPNYISRETQQTCYAVKELANTIAFDIGGCIARRDSGDAAWFLLTNNNELTNMYAIMCTPYCVLAEYQIDGEFGMEVVHNTGLLLENLCNRGFRKLTRGELKEFNNG